MSKVQCPFSKWKKSCLHSKAGSSWETSHEGMCHSSSTLTFSWIPTIPGWCRCLSGRCIRLTWQWAVVVICSSTIMVTIICTIPSTTTWCTSTTTTITKCTTAPHPTTVVQAITIHTHLIFISLPIQPTGLDHSTTLASWIQVCSPSTSLPCQVPISSPSNSTTNTCRQLPLSGTETSLSSSWTKSLRKNYFLEKETHDQLNPKVAARIIMATNRWRWRLEVLKRKEKRLKARLTSL